MSGQIDRMVLRSTGASAVANENQNRSESGVRAVATIDGHKEGEVVDDTLGTRTVYVIVQENLFHGSSGPLSSVFDLKGVLRYGAERKGVYNSNVANSLTEDSSTHGSVSTSVQSVSPASGLWTSSSTTGHPARHQKSYSSKSVDGMAVPRSISLEDSATLGFLTGDRAAQLGPANPQVLLDGDFLRCTGGLPVPLFERDKALMNVAIFNDTMFLQMLNVIDYSLLVGVQEPQTVMAGGAADGGNSSSEEGTVVVNTMTAGIIDYLHPYNVAKRMEGYFKNAQHELKLRAAESTIQKASEYKRRFRASADLYFMALPSSDL